MCKHKLNVRYQSISVSLNMTIYLLYNTGWSNKNQTETFFNYKQDIFHKTTTLFAAM